jgi:hypothetical protein
MLSRSPAAWCYAHPTTIGAESVSVSVRSRITQLNDAFRKAGSAPGWFLTAGVEAKGTAFAIAAVAPVRSFDAFSGSNDPHGDHDFGSVRIGSERLFWKIDYYDPTLTAGSRAPEDPNASRRVLTIMLASEY